MVLHLNFFSNSKDKEFKLKASSSTIRISFDLVEDKNFLLEAIIILFSNKLKSV